MVKSKKMSKTSIAVIVLAILLVLSLCLGLTGAWFTGSKNDTSTGLGDGLKFGQLGAFSIEVTEAQWKDANNDDVNPATRAYVMPGDTVTGAGVAIEYDATAAAATEKKVYYAISDGTNWYTISAGAFVAIPTEGAGANEAGILDSSSAKVNLAVSGVNPTTGAPGNIAVTNANAANINNQYQGTALVYGVGIQSGEVTYTFYIVQFTNQTASSALALMKAGNVEAVGA